MCSLHLKSQPSPLYHRYGSVSRPFDPLDLSINPGCRGKPCEVEEKGQGDPAPVPLQNPKIHQNIGEHRAVTGGEEYEQIDPRLCAREKVEIKDKESSPS